MIKTLAISLFALATVCALPAAGQTKKKVGGEPNSPKQSATTPDPLSLFQQIAKNFETFFAAGPRKLIERQTFRESSSGEVVHILEYSGREVGNVPGSGVSY